MGQGYEDRVCRKLRAGAGVANVIWDHAELISVVSAFVKSSRVARRGGGGSLCKEKHARHCPAHTTAGRICSAPPTHTLLMAKRSRLELRGWGTNGCKLSKRRGIGERVLQGEGVWGMIRGLSRSEGARYRLISGAIAALVRSVGPARAGVRTARLLRAHRAVHMRRSAAGKASECPTHRLEYIWRNTFQDWGLPCQPALCHDRPSTGT